MKGVILCGGQGTRLRPATNIINKHLLPIVSTPMVLYPLHTLKALGSTDILIVTGGNHIGAFAELLGDGSEYGVKLTYRVQKEAGGIAQALSLAENFAAGEPVMVILGDNIFEVPRLRARTLHSYKSPDEAMVFIKTVHDPERFGVIDKTETGYVIEEKPSAPKSNKAVTGLYVFPADVFSHIKTLKPSARGELEITDINNIYCKENRMVAVDIEETFWSDCGTPDSLANATRWFLDSGNPARFFGHGDGRI